MFYQFYESKGNDYFRIVRSNTSNYPPHLHFCYELIVCTQGELTATVNNAQKYDLKSRDAVLVFPSQIHALSSAGAHHFAIIFAPKYVEAYDADRQGLVPASNRLHLTEDLMSDLQALRESTPKYEIMGSLYKACGYFHKSASYVSSIVGDSHIISKIFAFLEKNFNKKCSLETLAKETGYEYTYLSHCFKNFTGISYTKYVRMMRLNYAGVLLGKTKSSVLECAIECGYASLRSFNRNFKSYYGITPHDYRKNAWCMPDGRTPLPDSALQKG